jgi:general secretion pathway protein A
LYTEYWGLAEPPFQNVPDPRFFFPSHNHREGLMRLLYLVDGGKGAGMLTGEIGCGKTTLARSFVRGLPAPKYEVGVITNPSLPRIEFLEEVNLQLGIPVGADPNKGELLRNLNDGLLGNFKRGKRTVLVVDEAHVIEDPQILEELRLLLNFQLNDRFLLTLILVGQPELIERIAAVKPLDQRIEVRHHLTQLGPNEAMAYVLFRLRKAGSSRAIFSEEALRAIYQVSGGLPRRINIVCDLCLLEGSRAKVKLVDSPIVKKVADEMPD